MERAGGMWAAVTVVLLGMALLTPAEAESQYREITVPRGGTLTGTVTLQGPIPPPYVIWVKKDAHVFGEKLPDERLLVSSEGKIQNVVLTLEEVSEGKRWPLDDFTLTNQGGRFISHVQVVRRGAEVEIVNRDPVLHNTHGFQKGRTVFNVGLPIQDQKVRARLRRSGMIDVTCDAHDWMNAWIIVQDHPYFAITDEGGSYTITEVPPGTYTMTAWHEKLGKKETQVTVTAGTLHKVDFTFSP